MVGPLLRSSVKMSRCSIVTNRSTPCLRTLARESLTRSGSMSNPHALQAYSLGRRHRDASVAAAEVPDHVLAGDLGQPQQRIDHLLWRGHIFDVGSGPFARLAQVDRFEV